MTSKKGIIHEETSFLSWPLDQLITFTSAMNLIKNKKKNRIEPNIKRFDVYNNITKNRDKFGKHFHKHKIQRKQIYNYMNEFVSEGYFISVKEMETKTGTIQELTSTQKAERLYEWLWISTNLKSKEDIINIVGAAIKELDLSNKQKDIISKSITHEIEERRSAGFPLSLSKELIEKLLKEKD